MKSTLLTGLLLLYSIAVFPVTNPNQWVFQTNGRIYSSPVITGETILFGSGDSTFYAVNKNNGKLVWKYKTRGAVHSGASKHGKSVCFGSTDGSLYSVGI